MPRTARDAGFDVLVAANFKTHAAAIRAEGFSIHPIPFHRGSLSCRGAQDDNGASQPSARIRPAVVHHSGLQVFALGGIAGAGQNMRQIHALNGPGYIFSAPSLISRSARLIVSALLRLLLNRANGIALVQNPDDRAVLETLV